MRQSSPPSSRRWRQSGLAEHPKVSEKKRYHEQMQTLNPVISADGSNYRGILPWQPLSVLLMATFFLFTV